MAAKYLLDSTILIDHLNGIPKATDWLLSLKPDEAALSVITRAEVLSKSKEQWEEISYMLDQYTCFVIGPEEADLAAGLRQKYSVKLPDAFQAVLAMSRELVLVTRDTADFKKISNLKLKTPYII